MNDTPLPKPDGKPQPRKKPVVVWILLAVATGMGIFTLLNVFTSSKTLGGQPALRPQWTPETSPATEPATTHPETQDKN